VRRDQADSGGPAREARVVLSRQRPRALGRAGDDHRHHAGRDRRLYGPRAADVTHVPDQQGAGTEDVQVVGRAAH